MPAPRHNAFPPLTISRRELLSDGGDDAFREVIGDLVDYAMRLARVRELLARQAGLTPPQYKLLMELAHWRETRPTISEIAAALHVTLPFITTETNRMVDAGLLKKTNNTDDRRRVHLALTEKGRAVIRTLAPHQSAVNDALFREIGAADMKALGRLARKLLAGSDEGLALAAKAPPARRRKKRV